MARASASFNEAEIRAFLTPTLSAGLSDEMASVRAKFQRMADKLGIEISAAHDFKPGDLVVLSESTDKGTVRPPGECGGLSAGDEDVYDPAQVHVKWRGEPDRTCCVGPDEVERA
jgi:hypothetical protein